MTTYDLEILIRTKKTGDGVQQAGQEVDNLGKRLNSTLDTINKSVVAAAAAGATFKQAFDLAKEGAQLGFTRQMLDRLARSIDTTADVLESRLTAATGGLVANSELIASATDIINLGLAKDEDGVVRLATVISKLGLDMQQVILTFANNSKARLDSLGLSVETVTAKAAELEAQGFKGDAFDQAVLESLEEKLALTGDTADSDVAAFLRLEAQVKNTSDAFKEWLANGLLPVVEALSGGYGDQVEQIIDDNIETAKSFDELVAEAQKIDDVNNIMGGLGTAVTGTSQDVREGLIDVTRQMAGTADGFGEFEAAITDWSAKSRNQFYSFLRAQGLTIEEFYEQEKAAYAVDQAIAELVPQTAKADEIMLRYAGSTQQAAVNTEDLAAATAGADAVLLQNYSNLQRVQEGWDALTDAKNLEAARALVEPFNEAADPINELISAQADLDAAQGEWVQTTISTAGQVEQINAQLAADLSKEQRDAYRDILNTVDEGSAEWLDAYNRLQDDLTDSQRQALIAQQADLASQPDRLANVYTGDAEGAEEAQARITAANEAIQQSYRETAAEAILAQQGVTEETLDLLVGIGYLTQEQADARLEFANTTTAIEELTASTEFHNLTLEEQTNALNALIAGEAGTAAEAINLAEQQTAVNDALNAMPKAVATTVTIRGLDDASTSLNELLRQMNDLDGRNVSANVTVRTDTELPDLSGGGTKGTSDKTAAGKQLGGPFSPGRLYRVGEGGLPEIGMLRSSGKLFMIPGEGGQVFSNSQAKQMLGGYTDNSQISIVNNSLEAAATTNALVQERRRARLDAYMGVG